MVSEPLFKMPSVVKYQLHIVALKTRFILAARQGLGFLPKGDGWTLKMRMITKF